VIYTSVLTCDKAQSVPHFYGKYEVESLFEEKGVEFVSLRPGAFLDQSPDNDFYAGGLKRGSLYCMGNKDIAWTMILSDEVARCVAEAALDPSIPRGSKIDLGAEDGPLSPAMLGQYTSEFAHSPVSVTSIPWGLLSPLLYLFSFFKADLFDLREMFTYFLESGNYVADTSLQAKYFGTPLTNKESVFRYCEMIGVEKKQ
jgi:hypothetical protein